MDDYKNTKEGRTVSQAKIFSPFAALRGFDDEISEEGAQTLRVPKAELSEEEKSALSVQLAGLRRGMTVTVRYFRPDLLCQTDPPVGCYQTVTGTVQALDPVDKTLRLVLDGPHTGPRVEKEKSIGIPLENIESLA